MAGFAAGQPSVNFDDDAAVFSGYPLQNTDELSIAKVRHLPAPQTLHSIQVQVLDANDSVLACQFIRQLEEPIPPAVADPLVGALQIL